MLELAENVRLSVKFKKAKSKTKRTEKCGKMWKMLRKSLWGESDGEVEVRGYAAAYGGFSFEVS